MKRSFALIVLLILLPAFSALYAQNYFNGKLQYSLTYEGNGAEDMAIILPHSIDVWALGHDIRIKINGGMTDINYGYFLVKNNENQLYIINDTQKVVYRILKRNPYSTFNKPVITDLGVTEVVQGYTCRKYRIDIYTEDGVQNQFVWLTDDLILPPITPEVQALTGNLTTVEGIRGTIIKQIIMAGGASTEMTLAEISEELPKAADMSLPQGYQVIEKDFDAYLNGY